MSERVQYHASTTLLRKLAEQEKGDEILAPELLHAADELDRLRAENEALRKTPSVEALADVIRNELHGVLGVPWDTSENAVQRALKRSARAVLKAMGRDEG